MQSLSLVHYASNTTKLLTLLLILPVALLVFGSIAAHYGQRSGLEIVQSYWSSVVDSRLSKLTKYFDTKDVSAGCDVDAALLEPVGETDEIGETCTQSSTSSTFSEPLTRWDTEPTLSLRPLDILAHQRSTNTQHKSTQNKEPQQKPTEAQPPESEPDAAQTSDTAQLIEEGSHNQNQPASGSPDAHQKTDQKDNVALKNVSSTHTSAPSALGENPTGTTQLPTLIFTSPLTTAMIWQMVQNEQAFLVCQADSGVWYAWQQHNVMSGFMPFHANSAVSHKLSQRAIQVLPDGLRNELQKTFNTRYQGHCLLHLRLSRSLNQTLSQQQRHAAMQLDVSSVKQSDTQSDSSPVVTLFDIHQDENQQVTFSLAKHP